MSDVNPQLKKVCHLQKKVIGLYICMWSDQFMGGFRHNSCGMICTKSSRGCWF